MTNHQFIVLIRKAKQRMFNSSIAIKELWRNAHVFFFFIFPFHRLSYVIRSKRFLCSTRPLTVIRISMRDNSSSLCHTRTYILIIKTTMIAEKQKKWRRRCSFGGKLPSTHILMFVCILAERESNRQCICMIEESTKKKDD